MTVRRHIPEPHFSVVPASEVGEDYARYALALSWTSFPEDGDANDGPDVHHLILDDADLDQVIEKLQRGRKEFRQVPPRSVGGKR